MPHMYWKVWHAKEPLLTMAVSGLFTFIDQLFVYYVIGVCAVVYDIRV